MSDVVGGVIGWILGQRGRSHVFERRYRRAVSGRDVGVGALAQFEGAPDWRETPGVLRRRAGHVTWTPRLRARATAFTVVPPRRWKVHVLALDVAQVIGTRVRRSAARGDRVVIELAGIREISHLAVRPQAARIAKTLLRGA